MNVLLEKTSEVHKPVDADSCVDFDLHGLVRIRLVDGSPRDVAAVTRQLGPIQAPPAGEADITIRFVDRLDTSSQLRYLGVSDAGFTDDAFLVLRGKHKTTTRVQIPFDRIGSSCEIVCQRGVSAVPLLIAIVNLTALAKGALPMHASALTYNGTGVLVTGWAKGGKTETLLGFVAHGAKYVGDEWIYLSADGGRMNGIPEPIRVWDWHLRELPQYWRQIKRRDRARLRALRLLIKSLRWTTRKGAGRRVSDLLQRQQYVHLPPQTVFGRDGYGSLEAVPEKVFFVASHQSSDITIQPIDSQEIAERMVFSLEEERTELLSYYRKFRFAFPDRSNELIERTCELQRQRLKQALEGKEAYAVYHPYPVSIEALFQAIQPLV